MKLPVVHTYWTTAEIQSNGCGSGSSQDLSGNTGPSNTAKIQADRYVVLHVVDPDQIARNKQRESARLQMTMYVGMLLCGLHYNYYTTNLCRQSAGSSAVSPLSCGLPIGLVI